MTGEIINIMIYIMIFLTICAVGLLGVYLKRKFNITKEETDLLKIILNATGYVISNINIPINKDINKIIKYVLEAIDWIEKYSSLSTIKEKKENVKYKTLEICKENDIPVDDNLIKIIDEIIQYFIDKEMLK